MKDIKLNALDKVINFVNPEAGARRLKARMTGQLAVRRYDAAGFGKRAKNWNATGSSANTEILMAGTKLRDRSRDLIRNNAYAARAVKGIAANVVGSGIRASIKHSDPQVQEIAKKLWEDWAEKKICDVAGNLNFYGMQFQTMRGVAESGEMLIRQVRDASAKIPLQIQILEPDFIDTSKDGIITGTGNNINLGIEFNKRGKRVAYWLFDQHPGETNVWKDIESQRIPADQISHCYFMERAGQQRGIPFGVASFLKMKDFDEYEDAQLIRQKIAACFSVFIHSDGDVIPNGGVNPNGGPPLERVEPGIIEYLTPGQEVTFADPPTTEGYDMYAKKMLQGIAAGYDMTYETLTTDLSNVNFSSGRMGWIEFGRMITQWQNQIIIGKLCDDVFQWFLKSANIAGLLPEDVTVSWTPPTREMIDPIKETKGKTEQIRSGLKSRSQVIREMGGEPDEVMSELIADAKALDAAELKLTTDPRFDPNQANQPGEEDTEENDNKKQSETE